MQYLNSNDRGSICLVPGGANCLQQRFAPAPGNPPLTKRIGNGEGMLVVIDPAVEAPHTLASGVRPGAAVLLLDPNSDSIGQITAALAEGNYTSLHLVSHGSPGCLHLGKTTLSLENIPQYRQQLLEGGVAEILVYGCNVAASPALLMQLKSLTGANIAASARQVGRGNWTLEWQTGEITADTAFEVQLRQQYRGVFVVSFTGSTYLAGSSTRAVAVGDFNGDENEDLASSSAVLLGDGAGDFSSPTPFPVGVTPFSVAVGDFNGDGQEDLAVANQDSDNVSVLLGNGDGTFSSQTTFAAGSEPRSVAIGDFNGDGNEDLAVANYGNYGDESVSVLGGNGSGGFDSQTTFAASADPTTFSFR